MPTAAIDIYRKLECLCDLLNYRGYTTTQRFGDELNPYDNAPIYAPSQVTC